MIPPAKMKMVVLPTVPDPQVPARTTVNPHLSGSYCSSSTSIDHLGKQGARAGVPVDDRANAPADEFMRVHICRNKTCRLTRTYASLSK
mgnify:CR=1 FL=1